ncbi:UvrD-helicase domain-containing protein [Leeuwenhoekiella marinoflava]|uniref:DNA 3'-5' helicase n=2 Tax=Leeuwenhoekiella marinoflava TaxID=988 RepID=A0A4Q0PS12_9FLAO|nr:UvrD-helicase domain-containing protein [Leeuwenhoekiella marinoflava]RXG33062.1 ATP-dependent exoDNAse (exonuclease V) beta subunit [Leeuwenhoekiella marinoflava]SHE37154.1 ATP-dependent exoDNAse (exonuclease V) beta subunit (contains helicase and exonuclease domains) [Leeuwenhoekiella marinoflava DSM 3653]
MQNHPSISIYNASAGAGKTFALVKNYLCILFKSNNEFKYRRILAITFTNKAVAEMKMRIVKNLQEFSEENIFEEPSPMLLTIEEETELSREEIHLKSKRLLKNIIQDFASFDVVTIDNFTHRIIRTFAHDLKIPQNFEVELNTQDVLEQAVDNLIDKAGRDPLVTQVLLDYAFEKIDDDKSWDISLDFYEISRLLLSENDREFLKRINGKSLEDFAELKKHLKASNKKLDVQIKESAKSLLDFFSINGLEEAHFKGKYLPKAVTKFSEGIFALNTSSGWVMNLGEEPMYTKTQKDIIKQTLDQIAPEITTRFNTIKSDIFQLKFQEELYKKLTPLSVLQAIQKEVNILKSENNLVLISDFNELIHKNIANQPTPFIYERLGERYENYFIDEFQDTSVLQWNNLVPLIDNAVSTNQPESLANSLMLVGDPKQAIYRWRGGDAGQFISLSKDEVNPFQNRDKKTIDLPFNYRSYDQIIHFNNSFFTEIASVFAYDEYKNIYTSGNAQQVNSKTGGYVSISFVDADTNTDAEPLYLDEVIDSIKSCQENGFQLHELCILVRRNAEGVSIAQRLQEEKIPVISSESLLLKQSPQVQFIINLLHFTLEPDSNAISIKLLEYLAKFHLKIEDKHEFYKYNLKYSGAALFNNLLEDSDGFNFNLCSSLPIYEAVEYIIRSFNLNQKGGSYLQFFLDAIYDFSQKNYGGIPEFIIWWERKKDKLSISTPPASEAVQIMTIHKAKGLEFPVVIYPFAHTDLYPLKADSYNWYLPEENEFLGFEALLLGQKSELLDYNEQTSVLYHQKRIQQQLDHINVLYVALTRSVEQLYIISKTSKFRGEPKNFSDLLRLYLESQNLFNTDQNKYSFGKQQRISHAEALVNNSNDLTLISTAKEAHDLVFVTQAEALWDTERLEAISFGNIIHELMAGIKTESDINSALKKAVTKGMITNDQLTPLETKLRELILDLQKHGFFNPQHQILNERAIHVSGNTLRPDRVEINTMNQLWLLDYKTGDPQKDHNNQLKNYENVLLKMNYQVVKKAIIYLNSSKPVYIL